MDPISILASNSARRKVMQATGALRPSGGEASATTLPEDQQQSMLASLARSAGGALDTVGRVLDYPGAIARGVLAGKPTSGFSWDTDTRVTGKELLEQYGLLGKDANPYYSAFAGLAAEIALDPLALVSGPLRALTGAGRAAQAAGILPDATTAAMKALGGIEKAKDATITGRNAYKFLGGLLPMGKAATAENALYRPMVGQRVAQNMVTLEETIKAARDPVKAMENVTNYLKTKGIDYDSVKGQKLGGVLGLNSFGIADPIILHSDSALARGAMDLLDAGGQMARWSAPVRFGSQLFDQRVGGRRDAYEQLSNLKWWDDLTRRQGAAREANAEFASLVARTNVGDEAKRLLGSDTLASEQGRDFLTRLWEDVPTQGDMRLRAAIGTGQTDELVKAYGKIQQSVDEGANALGMIKNRWRSKFGGGYVPRSAKELEFGEYGGGMSRKNFYARSIENEARAKSFDTPGLTFELRQLSALPRVRQFIEEGANSKLSISDLADDIKKFIDTKHGADTQKARAYMQSLGLQYDPLVRPVQRMVAKLGPDGKPLLEPVLDEAGNQVMVVARNKRGGIIIDKKTNQPKMVPKMKKVISQDEIISRKQAQEIARRLMRFNPSLPKGTPLFSEHPLASISRMNLGQARAQANADTVYRSLAEGAIKVGDNPNAIAGAGFRPLNRALNEAAASAGLQTSQRTGGAARSVENILKREIAIRNNVDPAKINLKDYAIPEKVVNRLTSVADFYSKPRAQEDVMNWFGQVGQLFKSFLLAFPARFTRDIYSNAYQVLLLTGNPLDVGYGVRTAMKIMSGQSDEAAELLKQIPGYGNDAAAIQQKLNADVARTGVLQTLASNDLLTANPTGVMNQLVPGMDPQRPLDFAKELIPDGSRSLAQMAGDYFTFKGVRIPGVQKFAPNETRNAILNASQKAGDYIDSVFRLGGMLALMRRGIAADEAAKRVTNALVDYSSLTQVERGLFRSVFPWWAYNSRAGKFAAEQLINTPGGFYAQTLRGFNRLQESDENTYVPEALRQQFAVRIGPQGDTTTFLRDIDIPGHDVISLLSPSRNPSKAVQSTFYNLVQQSNPLIQGVIEQATNTDLFSRRPLDQADTSLDRIYKRTFNTPYNMDPLLRQAIELTPAPRISGIVGGLVDPRLPMDQKVAKTLANTLLGIKFQTVDKAYQYSDAMRLLADQIGPNMKQYTKTFIPKELQPYLTPEQMRQFELYQATEKKLKEARAAR